MKTVLKVSFRLLRWKIGLIALVVCSSICNLAAPMLMGVLVTSLQDIIAGYEHVIWLLACLVIVSVLSLLLGYVQSVFQIRSAALLDRDFRQYVWRHLLSVSVMKLYGEAPSVWMQKICGDASMACSSLRMLFFSLLNFGVFFVGICICVFRREPLMIVVFVIAVLFGFVVHYAFRRRIVAASRALREGCYVFNATTFDILMLHPFVRMLRLRHVFEPKFDVVNGEQTERRIRSEIMSSRYNFTLQIEMVVVHFIVLSCCIWLFMNGQIAIGEVVSFDLLVGQLSGGIANLLSFLPQLDQGLESARSVAGILGLEREGLSHDVAESSSAVVELRNVSFEYDQQGRRVLSNVTANVRKNEYICCCGGNGSGKTTLMNLILGILKATSGSVGVSAIRPAVIPQRVVVFRDSLLENVRMCDKTISRSAVEETLNLCGLGEWMRGLVHGLDTKLTCDNVSGGELQRIGIARALVRSPDLLIVDEVANNLDVIEKTRIHNLISSIRDRCTIISVTHDLESVRMADRVWFLKNGSIVDLVSNGSCVVRSVEELLNVQEKSENRC